MGEIPVEKAAKPSAARWLAALLAVVVAAALLYRMPAPVLQWIDAIRDVAEGSAASGRAASASRDAARRASSVALPNPVAGALPAEPAAADAPTKESLATGAAPTASPAPQAPSASAAEATPAAPAPSDPGGAAPGPATGASPAAASAEAQLVLSFKGTSWVEVKDARGRVVVQMTGGPGMTQTVSAVPPLELALGNAPAVAVTFRGHPLDLEPYTRGNVARVALR